MRAKNVITLAAAVFVLGATLIVAPGDASAAPGTCKCNMGCHANPGQCLNGNGCNVGYAPSCGFRSPGSGAECPKSDYISCDGTCTCKPVPGFCEIIGGADYCDAGPPDTGVPDTYVEPPDTYVEPDTYVPDTYVPPDTYVEPDTYVPPPVDSCVPLECPPGTHAVAIPGACDPFCAQPCGGGEFKCAGFAGTQCQDGFCVPKCLVSGCPACQRCGLGDGECFDPGTCEDSGVSASDTGSVIVGEDAPSSLDAGVGAADATANDGSVGAAADPFGEADPKSAVSAQGGCGCSVPGESSTTAAAALGSAAALAILLSRRRRR